VSRSTAAMGDSNARCASARTRRRRGGSRLLAYRGRRRCAIVVPTRAEAGTVRFVVDERRRAALLRNGGGLVDAPGRRVVGPKGKYPHCPPLSRLSAQHLGDAAPAMTPRSPLPP